MNTKYQLAQLNIADSKAELTSDVMSGFASRLDEINMLSENSPGFVWRYQDEEGEQAPLEIFNNPLILVNMTVWEDIESLKHFVYKTVHKELIKGRKSWFHKIPETHQVIWWVPAGHIPSLKESKEKLDLIRSKGPTENAFNFVKSFEAPK